jgi:allene oxide cyclase-like protein
LPHTGSRTLAAAAAVALFGAAIAFTEGSNAQAVTGQARTLHIVEKGGGLKFVDNPPKATHQYDFSAGDVVIVSRDLYTQHGARAGSLKLVCIATSQTTQQCTGTETLAGGTLEVAGISTPAPNATVAITGGTGSYRGARGTSTSTDRHGNNDTADQTITFQR